MGASAVARDINTKSKLKIIEQLFSAPSFSQWLT